MSVWSTMFPVPLAWRQLVEHRARCAVAVLGVAFAVVLVLMQLGFSNALYASAVRLHQSLAADLVLISPQYSYLGLSKPFARRRLDQTRSDPAVMAVTPLSFDMGAWKNPETGATRNLLVIGVDPSASVLRLRGLTEQLPRIHRADVILFDAASRPEFGVQAAALRSGGGLTAELGRRRVVVDGVFDLGTSFAVDGSTVTSESTFLRLFPHRREGLIDIGLVRLHPGSRADAVRARLTGTLPADVEVLTKAQFMTREQAYWRQNTPIGYVFTFGVIMGLAVGAVVVYLILFVNVTERLPEFATLKAIGFADAALFGIVGQQALLLAVAGFVPGALICCGLYRLTAHATRLPLELTPGTGILVFALTLLMCGVSGVMALRKVRAADPAEVFA